MRRLPVNWRTGQAARLRQPLAWKSALRPAAWQSSLAITPTAWRTISSAVQDAGPPRRVAEICSDLDRRDHDFPEEVLVIGVAMTPRKPHKRTSPPPHPRPAAGRRRTRSAEDRQCTGPPRPQWRQSARPCAALPPPAPRQAHRPPQPMAVPPGPQRPPRIGKDLQLNPVGSRQQIAERTRVFACSNLLTRRGRDQPA